MSATALPPSERDFEAFRLVKIEQKSTRAVAAELGISQTRVCQVVDQVVAFLSEVLPAENELQREGRLRVARYIATERLEHLYGEAYHAWEASKVESKSVREVHTKGAPTMVVLATRTGGETRFLSAAAKLATHSVRITTAMIMASVPREKACSKSAAKPTKPLPSPPTESVASDSPVMDYARQSAEERRTEGSAQGPVQAPTGRKLTAEQRQARSEFLGRDPGNPVAELV